MKLFPKIQASAPAGNQDIVNLVLSTLQRDGLLGSTGQSGQPTPITVQHLPADDSEGGLL